MYKLFKSGYPTCHESCARHYFAVIYDVGEHFETRILMSLS